MSDPKATPIPPASKSSKSSAAPVPISSPSPVSFGTPPVSIPNIPPRSFTPSSIGGAAGKLHSATSRRGSTTARLTPQPSNDELGRKKSPSNPASASKNKESALIQSLESAEGTNATGEGSEGMRRKSSAAPLTSPDMMSSANPNESSFSNIALEGATLEDKARVLRRHLVSAEERGGKSGSPGGHISGDVTPVGDHGDSGIAGGGNGGASAIESRDDDDGSGPSTSKAGGSGYGSTDNEETFPLPYDAPGGDVTHDLYKWQHDHRPRPGRSASFSHVPLDRSALLDPSLAHIKEPGGFRRNFVVNRAQEQGLEAPTVLRNVIDFLFLYGHFAGEDLEEDDDDDDDDEDEPYLSPAAAEAGFANGQISREELNRHLRRDPSAVPSERAPLLGSRQHSKTRHRRTRSGPPSGTASVTQATLMLLKGFVGTGILFMGKAFFNGGLLFSTVVMLSIAAISLYSFLLLIKTYLVVPGSFGDIGGILYGNKMRLTILTSITVSQIGFVAAYTIFIAENLQAFVLAVTDCKTFIQTRYLIFAQLVVFLPLAMIRNLAKLSGTALVADAFILIGLIYIGVNETTVLAKRGVADVVMFNKESFPLLIGTAVFAFEGIGLVIPITESMRQPQKFPPVLSGVMFVVAVLFAGFGVLGYATYGSDIQTVVLVNLPQEDKFVQAVQFLYSVAILLSIPLQLFPAVRIMENGLFSRSGKNNPSVKWQKNVFRAATVVFCSLLSWAGSKELDKFVALIGSFACIPLCFIYPPLLHLKACAKTRKARIADYTLLAFGILVGAYTTVQTCISLFQPGSGAPTQFGKCSAPKDA